VAKPVVSAPNQLLNP